MHSVPFECRRTLQAGKSGERFHAYYIVTIILPTKLGILRSSEEIRATMVPNNVDLI